VIGFLKRVGKLFIENRKHLPKDTPMNSTFKLKLIQALNKKNGNKGFTLIELLVVVIIIGVLAAIALPNLLNQVAKGRQAEARSNLGAVNRTQQAFRLENTAFGVITGLPIAITGTYYNYADVGTPNATAAGASAIAKTNYDNDIRDYASSVGQTTAGVFSAIICEATHPTTAGLAAPAGGTGNCTNGTVVQ
jgi:prepilin-type N-terminal cleavage/methylation domain-containing protein